MGSDKSPEIPGTAGLGLSARQGEEGGFGEGGLWKGAPIERVVLGEAVKTVSKPSDPEKPTKKTRFELNVCSLGSGSLQAWKALPSTWASS
eukprot:1186444-Prorocentrum_minimum.AAC.2